MTDKKRAGRPKGHEKKLITMRLDVELYNVVRMYEDLVIDALPEVKVLDIHQAIFHAFFFEYHNGELRAKDAVGLLDYLVEYVELAELKTEERWSFFHTPPAPEEVERFFEEYGKRKQSQEEYKKARLEHFRSERIAYDHARDYAKLLEELQQVQERLAKLERERV